MSMGAQQERYLYNTIQQASPAQLLLMLYDGAIRFCKMAVQDLEKNDNGAANTHLLRAQDIIRELMVTLDRKYPISEQLYALYEYFVHLLIQANLKKSDEPIHEVLGYLTDLRQTWAQAVKQTSQEAVR